MRVRIRPVTRSHIIGLALDALESRLTESLSVPRSVMKELQEHARRIEEIVATLEELSDKESMRRIRASLKDYDRGDYVVVEDVKKLRSVLEG